MLGTVNVIAAATVVAVTCAISALKRKCIVEVYNDIRKDKRRSEVLISKSREAHLVILPSSESSYIAYICPSKNGLDF